MIMKDLIRNLLRENILSEKLTDIDADVNFLYDKYFKDDIDAIERTGFITSDMFNQSKIDTSILTSPDSIKSNELNPCTIKINPGSNFYGPKIKIIGVGYARGAYDFVINNGNGNIEKAIQHLQDSKQKISLSKEFTESKIKGSIHHELVHWIDDTLNNKHIEARVAKTLEKNTKNLNGIPVDATRMEIQAQIHNIKQLYNKHKEIWNEISFQDMLEMSPSLFSIDNRLTGEIRLKWRKELKLRMNREGLLGKNMTN